MGFIPGSESSLRDTTGYELHITSTDLLVVVL